MISITTREREILYWSAHELTAKEIAGKLFISTHTVISHRKNLQNKLNARNCAGMVRAAFEEGLFPPYPILR